MTQLLGAIVPAFALLVAPAEKIFSTAASAARAGGRESGADYD